MASKLSSSQINQIAQRLLAAEEKRAPIAPLSAEFPDMSANDAYAIQLAVLEHKQSRGEVVYGRKAGLTAVAIQKLFGVSEPDFGHLLASMMVESGGVITSSEVIQAKAEPEIAFVLNQDLRGPGVTALDVIGATNYIVPVLEIIDSRVADWKIKLPDTIADNASCGKVVIGGPARRVDGIDLRLIGVVLEKNGEVIATGAGAAALGNPAIAVAWLANKLATFDQYLRKGELILPGSLTSAFDMKPGDHVCATFDRLGSVSVRFA
ncbi:MAG: fumarylacetoacetate hydrolase family protein [Candidatus Binataceae bacterium]|nr:fumarylacetoacetate hydrolase family protein [Candidatus Binataceae bacterium]